jgi:zeaxanthin glucosyltransferase
MDKPAYSSVMILAPPFYSHFRPLMQLALSLKKYGAEVIVGSSVDFQAEVEKTGLLFREVNINKNSNKGVAVETEQKDSEAQRLQEFLTATKQGAVETLMTQGRHRLADMFANPEELIEAIAAIDKDISLDLWIVDQLSYGATLALYGLDLPFITFCAPHPHSIPKSEMIYSIPPRWPEALLPTEQDQERLKAFAKKIDESFTTEFNNILQSVFHKPPVQSAFAITSNIGVVYNYPPFPSFESEGRLFAGHSFEEQDLPPEWEPRLKAKDFRVLIGLGTFLSSRDDVLRKLIHTILSLRPDAWIFVGAGPHAETLSGEFDHRVFAERFIPQRALLKYADVVIHHGGVSSFTETLYMAKPMIVLPFSSDQFNVAYDVESNNLGVVIDPNNFDQETLADAFEAVTDPAMRNSLNQWAGVLKDRGPDYIAAEILSRGITRDKLQGENNGTK